MRILVCDDTRSLWEMLSMMLPGHQCQWAPDEADALAKTAAGLDLAIVACCLGHQPTTGLTLALRGTVPVLVLSSDDLCRRKALDRGLPVLDRPFSWDALKSAIESTAQERRTAGAWGWG